MIGIIDHSGLNDLVNSCRDIMKNYKGNAEKLEQLNERFARQQERRRKTWRCLFVCLALLAAAILVGELLISFHRFDAVSALQKDIGIIGGADGPTAIFVSSARFQPGPLVVCLAVLILSVVGFIRTGRK